MENKQSISDRVDGIVLEFADNRDLIKAAICVHYSTADLTEKNNNGLAALLNAIETGLSKAINNLIDELIIINSIENKSKKLSANLLNEGNDE